MEQSFDPYRKWLGIPPDEQPPDHYRLLGIAQFEDDPDVISSSADRQMAHVRTFQTGRRSAQSQQILNELSAARLCLLSPDKKEEYDDQLRLTSPTTSSNSGGSPAQARSLPSPSAPTATIRSAKPRPTGPRKVGMVATAAKPVAAVSTLTTVGSGPRISAHRKTGRRKKSAVPMIFGLVGGGTLLLLVVMFLSGALDDDSRPTGKRSVRNSTIKKKTKRKPSRVRTADNDTALAKPIRNDRLADPTTDDSNNRPTDERGASDKPDDTPSDDGNDGDPDNGDPDTRDDSNRPDPFDPDAIAEQESETDNAAGRSLIPVPGNKALAIAVAEVKREFGSALDGATFPDDRAEIAADVFAQAQKTSDEEPIKRFALLDYAIRIYVSIVRVDQFTEIIDYTATLYDVDAIALKKRCFEDASKIADFPEQNQLIFQHSRNLVHQALAAEKMDQAEAFSRLCKLSATKTKNQPDRAIALQLVREVSDAKKLLKAVERSRTTLADKPEDPGANSILGRYYCFARNDWKQGLPMLAKGNDTRYRDLAQKDLSRPQDPGLRTKIGESWEALANRKNDPYQRAYRLRARVWFRGAADSLTDEAKKKILLAKIAEINLLVGDR